MHPGNGCFYLLIDNHATFIFHLQGVFSWSVNVPIAIRGERARNGPQIGMIE
jgi:hypothetical protein